MAKTKIEVDLVIKGGESVQQVENKTKSLKAQLKEMKTLLASGTLDSNSFNKLAAEAGALEDQIGDVSQRVKNLASDSQKLDALMSAAQGLVGGFAAVQGVTALLGDENEDLQKTMVKLQGAMSALAGIQAVANTLNKESALSTNLLGGAWTKMNNVMKASVLGGIAILVTALIYGLEKLTKVTSGVSEEEEKYNKVMKEGIGEMAEVTKSISLMSTSFDLAKKGVISKKEALYEYNKNFGETLGVARNVNEAEKIFREKTEAFIKSSLLRAEATALLNEASKKGVEGVTASMEDNISFGQKTLNVIGGLRNGFISFQADQSIAQADGTLERQKILKEEAKTFTEIANQKIEEARKIENENKIISKEQQDRVKDEKKGNEDAKAKSEQALQERIKRDQQALKDREQLAKTEKENIDSLSELDKEASDKEEQRKREDTAFNLAWDIEQYKYNKDQKKKLDAQELKDKQDIENAKMSIVNDSYLALNALGELALGQQFKNTNAGKALALAQIATDTALGFIQGLRIAQQSAIGLSGPAAALTMPVFYASQVAAVLGAASKAKSLLGGGGSTSAPSGSGGGGGSVSSQPPRMDKFESNRPAMNPNQRVYVLEKDITDSQGRVAKIRHNATLI
jgi:hypothetical protein